MRIGLVLEELDSRRGGLEQWTCQFVSHLARSRHEVHVLARRFIPMPSDLPIIPHLLETNHPRLAFAEAAETRLRSMSLDLVHDMGAGWCCDVFQPHGGSRPSLAEKHLQAFPQPQARHQMLDRRVVTTALRVQVAECSAIRSKYKVFVALSQFVADDLQRFHQVPRANPADL